MNPIFILTRNVEALSTISQDALRHMEGTVILHITFAIKQDQDLGKEFIKFLEVTPFIAIWKGLR